MWEFIVEHWVALTIGFLILSTAVTLLVGKAIAFGMGSDDD